MLLFIKEYVSNGYYDIVVESSVYHTRNENIIREAGIPKKTFHRLCRQHGGYLHGHSYCFETKDEVNTLIEDFGPFLLMNEILKG